ncbi:MAG: polysaccharide deacetylase family protein [Chthoniobacteraceae bacterium]
MILSDDIGATQVLKWQDGKQAVFMLEFDDSAPSAITTAIPELSKRGMPGTFYINPGNPPFLALEKQWESRFPDPCVVLGNHTFSHVGAFSVPQLDDELARCNDAIRRLDPGCNWPRLVSFGQPGGVPWNVSPEEEAALLAKYRLVRRPPFWGYPFQTQSGEAVLALVDAALATGEMGHHDFHGVGGDWHSTPLEIFLALLDKLEANRDRLWITDPVSWHQYATEREGAAVQAGATGPDAIEVELSTGGDPAFYDLPLTLATRVPSAWRACRVVQGRWENTVPVRDGTARYAALPGGEKIRLGPA